MSESEHRILGDRGQVTIPKKLRERLDLEGGDRVKVHEENGKIIIETTVTRDQLAKGYRKRAKRDSEIEEEMKHVSSEANNELGEAPDWEK